MLCPLQTHFKTCLVKAGEQLEHKHGSRRDSGRLRGSIGGVLLNTNCECCPVSFFITGSVSLWLSGVEGLNCLYCTRSLGR